MPRIDSHQHFWKFSETEYPWIRPDWPIRRSFLPEDLQPLLEANDFDACVAVQARQTIEETEWLLALASKHPFIAGVVGWVDLYSPDVTLELDRWKGKLVGVRHVVQDEPDDNFMLRPEFLRGIEALQEYDLAYDLLILPRQLTAAIEVTRRFPHQRFVLDHLAKPRIKDGQLEPWRAGIRELAQPPNVYCKLSGMVTEANWRTFKNEDFQTYLDVAWAAFGADRLMIGSDWPVCLLSSDYARTIGIVARYLNSFSPAEQEKVLGLNAARFYRLSL